MKRLLVVVVALFVGVIAFGQAKATIVFYTPTWGDAEFGQIAAKYMAEHPNVKVDMVKGPSTWDDHVAKSQLWMSTKYSGVDLEYQDDVFSLDMSAYGVAEDLWPYMSQAQRNDLTDIQLQYKKIWGGYYRVSSWQGMNYTWYNKKVFSKAGLAVPTTWDELMSTAKKLTMDTTGSGQIDQFGYMGPGSDGPMAHSWWSFLYEAGGEEWKLAPGGVPDPRAKQAFQFMKDLYTAAAPKDTPAIDYDQARAYLLQGKTAMEWDWHDVGVMAMQAHQLDEIGVMNFPAGPAGPYGIAHGWGVVVNKYGDNFKKNKQAVIDYELYLMRPDVHEITAKDELPAYKSTYADSAFMTKLFKDNPMSALASQWWKWRRTRQFTPKHGAEYMNGQGKLATQGIYGQATVDQTLIDMQNLIDSLKE